MEKRTVKQTIFIAAFLTLFFLIVFAGYMIWLKPAPTCFDNKQNGNETGMDCGGECESCEIKTLSPIQSSWIKYFPAGRQTAVVAEIKNPNQNYGADPFYYSIEIYSKENGKIKSFDGSSLIHPGEIKYLFETIDVDPQEAADAKIIISGVPKIKWIPKERFSKPDIQIRDVKIEQEKEKPNNVYASGFARNNNAFPLSKIKIVGILANSEDAKISASKTEMNKVQAFEEKFFKIIFPNGLSLKKQSSLSPLSPEEIFKRDLAYGSKGEDVKKLQEFLEKNGFFSFYAVTGYFGPVTEKAMGDFQKKFGLSPVNGRFDKKTRDKIIGMIKLTTFDYRMKEADASKTKIYTEAMR